MNNNFKKVLCLSAVCVLLSSNVSFADIQTNSDYSTDSFYNILTPDFIFPTKKEPLTTKNSFDILKTISDKHSHDKNIQKLYHESLGYFERENENRFNALNELKIAGEYVNKENIYEQLHIYDQIARSYTEVWKYKEAEKEYKKIAKLMNDNSTLLEDYQIINDYVSRMYYHLGTGELDKAFTLYKEGKILLDNKNPKDNDLEINLNEPVIQYYFITRNLKNAKEAIDFHWSLADKTDNTKLKVFTQKTYLNYYKSMDDIANIEKTLAKIKELNKGLYADNSIETIEENLTFAESYLCIADIYKHAKDYSLTPEKYNKIITKYAIKAEKHLNIALKAAEKYKEIDPTKYALVLQYTTNVLVKLNKQDEAEKTMTTAIEYFKKANPELAYFLFEGEMNFGRAYKDTKQYNKAINIYKDLEAELNKIGKYPFIEHQNLYDEIADAYSNIGKEKEALDYINKAIEISIEKFGANSVKTIDYMESKADIYKNLGKKDIAVEQAKEVLFKIKEAGISETYNNEFECYFLIAKYNLEKGKLDDALANANKALNTSTSKVYKDEVNELISEIYKQQGKKFKSLKYKLK